MTKRLFVAMIGCAFTLAVAPVEARTYDHDGIHESQPAKARTRSQGGASASRSCLKPSARALLERIEGQFGAVRLVSTCRPGARIAGTGKISKHATGEAIDFYAPAGRKAEVVRWLIANHHSGGVMTYARMAHIHVDTGYRFVSLGSGSGRATRIARRSTASTAVASRSQTRTERMAQASREMAADAVLRLAQKD